MKRDFKENERKEKSKNVSKGDKKTSFKGELICIDWGSNRDD